MEIRASVLSAIAALLIVTGPVVAGPGEGKGNGHGAETSAAARDPETRGLDKALAVVATTPANEQATESIEAAIKRRLERESSEQADVD